MPKTIVKDWELNFSGRQKRKQYERKILKDYEIATENDVVEKNFTAGKTCALGCLFLPLALLGTKKVKKVRVVYRRLD